MVSIRTAAPALLLVLAGCVSGPDHKPPEMPLPAKFSEGGTKVNGDIAGSQWWTAFGDSKLNAFAAQGLGQNLNIQQSLERINQAEAAVVTAGAGGLPSLTVTGDHTTSGQKGSLRTQTETRNSTSGGASVSWLLDLWGQYRRATESANASLDAAYSNVDTARLTYLQDLATSYVNARYYQALVAIARENLKSRRDTLSLTKFQLEAGAASRLDVVQAEGLVNSTLSTIPGFEINYRQAVHHIATLLNVPSSAIIAQMQGGGSQPVFRGSVRTGVPADLVRNRPDIRAAERNLAAATAQIGVAEAKLFPSITLSGAISPSYIHSSSTSGSLTSWSFGPALNLPIFDGGTLRAGVKSAESSSREQYIVWQQTVRSAIQDVEDALSAVTRDAQTVAALHAQVKSYQEALQLSTASYKDGASSLLDVLDAQRNVTSAQQSLAQAVQQSALDYIKLNVAIGAGYMPAGKATVAAAPAKVIKVAAKKTN
ncbi:efflux transporter outer membrane subunit [Rhizobium sp. P40RR-XXII]|uniref:efflux transporter outer membrane subunit n=1 Tax=unclassified Rhizobium TaxID=2613769 RepID=UPI00145784DB|nr:MULTISPECIES: efflux transporter outer membrane subunit [unclassified Rhizobium]NLR89498.1 efflux transporter outer membrane subunit [Rhizobium sp. P28RR-XV]NLS20550.1 efflux transporter outer membrane subunit [Rhizobium sp. P40RR-XXII]